MTAEAAAVAVQPVRVNMHEVRTMLRHSPEFFIEFFLGEELTCPVPDFHVELFSAMIDENRTRVVLAVPRGHAKTTLAKLACVWYLIFSVYRFVLYIGATQELAVPSVNDIAEFFETNNFVSVFGPVKWAKRQDGIGVYKFIIPSVGKTCILRGHGAGQRVRGINVDNERPQIAIADDFEGEMDQETTTNFKKMLQWWGGPFYKCLNQFKNKLIVLGNYTATQSVLHVLLKSNTWDSFLYGALVENGEPLWPDLWPIEKLRQDFLEYQELGLTEQWFAEMMNQPVPRGGAIIRSDEICYAPARVPGEGDYGCITIDPAISSRSWADRAAMAAHVWIDEESQWQTVEIRYWRGIDVIDMFWQAIDLAVTWGIRVIGIESAAMQQALEHIYNYLLMQNNLLQYRFVPLPTLNQKKSARIISWASMLKQTETRRASWALTQGDFIATQQLLMYEPAKRDNDDDIIDCCAYGPRMAEQYLMEIMQDIPGMLRGQVTPLYNLAEV